MIARSRKKKLRARREEKSSEGETKCAKLNVICLSAETFILFSLYIGFEKY